MFAVGFLEESQSGGVDVELCALSIKSASDLTLCSVNDSAQL